MKNDYERFVRPLLFSLDAEAAHHLTIALLRGASHVGLALRALKVFQPQSKPKQSSVKFSKSIGLAAGLDKTGRLPAWAALGFGFIEIGTVTAKAQPGNPRPRIFRLPKQQALINHLGFNNQGADVIAERLHKLRESERWPVVPVGINIGKSKITPLEEATGDYLYSLRLLRDFADYIVLNVSSPNTPGLRELQEPAALSQLLRAIRDENRLTPKPVLVKIAPDISSVELEEIIATCEQNEVAGIIATNTTLDHSSIPPVRNEIGRFERGRRYGKDLPRFAQHRRKIKMPVVAAGGIFDAESAHENLKRGRSFSRFTRATFIVARDFFAKLSKVSHKIDNRASIRLARRDYRLDF
jgi:dihydroorotate dehydrogenase